MKKMLLTIAALTLFAAANSQVMVPQETVYENYIQVNGTAEREIVPDEIYVRIVISENDTKGKVTVDKMEKDMISALRAIGVDVDTDLRVGDMSSSLHDKIFGKNSARTTATYQLKVSTAEMLGNVYHALGRIGISNLSVTTLNHSRIRDITDEVRVEAVKNAQKIAREMAQALGQEIGKAVYIVDYNSQVINTRSNFKAEMSVADTAYAGGEDASSLDFRNIKLNYSVTVKFALE